jgi:NAD(P)H-hydrate repair Nnr-like enzyme with NAD(P)H-hydrate epimerase domain
MHKLLTDMTEQAASVISCIVDMTNKVYAIPLPRGCVHKGGNDANANVNAFHFKQASPMLKKRNRDDDDDGDDGSDADLSPEKCANIVDCVIGEIDNGVLSPPHQKKVKVLPAGL